AIVVGPAIDDRQLWTPVAMRRWSRRRLPFERCRTPGIAGRLRSVEVARDHVVEENELRSADPERNDRDERIEEVRRVRNERSVSIFVVTPRHSEQAEIVHREIDQIGADERKPEVYLSEPIVPHPTRDFGIPVIDGAEDHKNWRYSHHHMEVGDDKVGSGEGHVDTDIAEEQSRQSSIYEREDERDCEQHRHGEVDVAL